MVLLHLDQVLLTGQSMPVPHQHDDMDTAERPEIDIGIVPDVRHGDAAQRDLHRLVPRH